MATGEGSAILLVTNVRKRDDGVYRCSVENIFGSLDKSIRVLVQGKGSSIPHHIHALTCLSYTCIIVLMISCDISIDPMTVM